MQQDDIVTEILSEVDRLAKLKEWYDLREQVKEIAKPLVEKEMELRKGVVTLFFPSSKEGTNTFPLHDGWQLKYQKKLDYSVQIDALAELKDEIYALNVPLDEVIKYTPKLSIAAYKTLRQINPQGCAMVDRVLLIKESSPTLELTQKKKK